MGRRWSATEILQWRSGEGAFRRVVLIFQTEFLKPMMYHNAVAGAFSSLQLSILKLVCDISQNYS